MPFDISYVICMMQYLTWYIIFQEKEENVPKHSNVNGMLSCNDWIHYYHIEVLSEYQPYYISVDFLTYIYAYIHFI